MEGIQNYSEQITIKDPEEAREFVSNMIKSGENPCVSVPEQYLLALKNGLKPYSSWIQSASQIYRTR